MRAPRAVIEGEWNLVGKPAGKSKQLEVMNQWLKCPASTTSSGSSMNANLTEHTEKKRVILKIRQFQDHCVSDENITATISTFV